MNRIVDVVTDEFVDTCMKLCDTEKDDNNDEDVPTTRRSLTKARTTPHIYTSHQPTSPPITTIPNMITIITKHSPQQAQQTHRAQQAQLPAGRPGLEASLQKKSSPKTSTPKIGALAAYRL